MLHFSKTPVDHPSPSNFLKPVSLKALNLYSTPDLRGTTDIFTIPSGYQVYIISEFSKHLTRNFILVLSGPSSVFKPTEFLPFYRLVNGGQTPEIREISGPEVMMRIKSKINVGSCFKERNPSNQVSIWNILYIIYIWIERVVYRPREVTSKKFPKFLSAVMVTALTRKQGGEVSLVSE